ncbi:alpha/beta hydrolase [Rhizobium sp. NLR17b]|uniref:alpha/beta fold hydrolase n=1 Tax=Rhizobium sp. NLR17b TaxID=2731114 RepID=UPI001C83C822|nr:alpha/beta hydrolase [Rhizobium sp. NLR17b]MBX5272703.1 alpha/beta hydrolase [Rhizobium sp. NLR17b]
MSKATFLTRDGVRLGYEVAGKGRPIFWQHGLGADRAQPAEVFPDVAGWQRIALECRGHGVSETGDERNLSVATFSQDVMDLAAHLGLETYSIGGISLGAAIALRVASLAPDAVGALILARPAWVADPAPATLKPYVELARLWQQFGREGGAAKFAGSRALADVEAVSPDNAQSLRWFFNRPRADSTVALLSRIPLDGPGVNLDAICGLNVPTLVIGNDRDYVHPLATARKLAELIPGAAFREVTGKSTSKERYVAEFRDAIASFLASQVRA